MRLATQVRATLALFIALLAAALVYHVRGSHAAVARAHDLSALGRRLRVVASEQAGRLDSLQSALSTFRVSRDAADFALLYEGVSAFRDALESLRAASLTRGERMALSDLSARWATVDSVVQPLADAPGLTPAAASDALRGVEFAIALVKVSNRAVADSMDVAIQHSLELGADAARRAQRMSVAIALIAFGASVLVSIVLVRAIVRPLDRLVGGTRALANGHFGHRLPADERTEFAAVSRDFNTMAERLEELDRLKRDFVSTVSHDLKTPLSSMQETVELLLDEVPGPLNQRQRNLLELNRNSGRRLAQMLAKLLDLSRLEAQIAPRREIVDIAGIVRDIVDRMGVARPGRGPALSLVGPGGRLLVHADAAGVAQVLENLLENAIKFSPPGGAIRVALADLPSRGTVLLSVADEGPGVPDSEKDRIFERFHQTATGRAVTGRGVGLGLSICRHIVAAHGGVIWVADHEPRGAVFCVLLPGPAIPVESAA